MPVRLSGKEIVKALARDGWDVERISGSHHVMRSADGRHVTVPGQVTAMIRHAFRFVGGYCALTLPQSQSKCDL